MRKHDLRTDAITATPVNFDWSNGYGDKWEDVLPDPEAWSEEYRRKWWEGITNDPYPVGAEGNPDEDSEDGLEAIRNLIDENRHSWEPMMSYYYPLPDFQGEPSEAQARLEEAQVGACSLVLVDGEAALMLTGGGMDLSWDICRAYIALGYFPPVHYAGKLPKMAGERDTQTAAIAVEACRIRQRWAENDTRDAVSVLKWTRDQAGKR